MSAPCALRGARNLEKVGHDLITASGTTLLGADDKAGVAILMTAMRHLIANPDIPHGPIRIAFSPDEEIGRGVDARLPKDLGADFAYVGTRFIAARESLVSDENRAMLVRSTMADIVTTQAVTGIASNWMRESLERAGFSPEALETKKKIDFSNLQDVKAWKHIWGAGHGVGQTAKVQTTSEIVDELAGEFRLSNAHGASGHASSADAIGLEVS